MKVKLKQLLITITCLISSVVFASGQSWPKNDGAFLARSSKAIPAFPKSLPEYKFAGQNKDFWGNQFDATGTIRISEGEGWEGISDFPNTMNHCSAGVFMIRWRSANREISVQSAVGFLSDNITSKAKAGNYGYMSASNCEQPFFRLVKDKNHKETLLVDVYYELKFWKAAP